MDRTIAGVVEKPVDAQRVIEAILQSAKTGKIGDGKVFVTEVQEAIRIRTDEHGAEAVS